MVSLCVFRERGTVTKMLFEDGAFRRSPEAGLLHESLIHLLPIVLVKRSDFGKC